jgi:hypothetical protein
MSAAGYTVANILQKPLALVASNGCRLEKTRSTEDDRGFRRLIVFRQERGLGVADRGQAGREARPPAPTSEASMAGGPVQGT